MSILLFLIAFHILVFVSLYFLFPKAGVDGWKGLVPGLNYMEWCKIIGKPKLHALWLLFPIVNIFIYAAMAVDMVRSFGRDSFLNSFLAVVATPYIFFKIAQSDEEQYQGPILEKERAYHQEIKDAKAAGNDRQVNKLLTNNPFKKTIGREWAESIIFAVFAAAFIRMFLIEAYVIPTPSMEGSLLVGDYLFVSKAHYGIRTPQTIAMIPLLHNTVPVIGGESYLENPKLPYYRLPALETIDLNDPIVFNWPVGDSIYLSPSRSFAASQVKQTYGSLNSNKLPAWARPDKLITRPLDKKDHYIKRCLGTPGDSLQIIDRQVYINGKAIDNPEKMQFLYNVTFPSAVPVDRLMSKYKLDESSVAQNLGNAYALFLDDKQKAELDNENGVTITHIDRPEKGAAIFPNDPKNFNDWTIDNFGPIWIPKKGETVVITPKNIALYERIINVYENNDLEIKAPHIYINGQKAKEYTFKQDYYWAMGDNRHNSEDSRAWGFVPHDHIVGKPLFIWMSSKNGRLFSGIRFNRIFKSASTL